MSSNSNNGDRGCRGRSSPEASTSGGAKRSCDDGENNSVSKRSTSDNKRVGNRRQELYQIVRTRPNDITTTSHQPRSEDEKVTIETNYFKLKSTSPTIQWTIYKYHVTFDPECAARNIKSFLIGQHRAEIGGYLFDGSQLFATRKLHENDENIRIQFQTKTRDETMYTITLRFTKIVSMIEQESLQVLNLILRRNMNGLNLTLVGRNFYDPQAKIALDQFRIQLWPGYETSIRNHEHGILLNCDVAHKTMRTDTVYDMLKECRERNPENFMEIFKKKVLGIIVLTNYNNKTYRIDDVSFEITPLSKFKKGDTEITIKQYYAERRGQPIHIKDPRQPLLISNPRARDLRGGERQPAWLVPELCRITGLDERQRNDMNLKQSLRPYAQMVPRIRRDRLIEFNRRIQSSREYETTKTEFGLELDRELVKVRAHCINTGTLFFGNGVELELNDPSRERSGGKASWDRECGRQSHPIYQPTELKRWAIICPYSMEREMKQLLSRMTEFSRNMNFTIKEPKWLCVEDDRNLPSKVNEIGPKNPTFLLFGTTTNNKRNSDLYSAIKKKCFSDFGISSQVVTRFILQQRNRFDSVATKLAIQICTKLGGAPWNTKIPVANAMTIGFDVVRDTINRTVTYGCLVATMDLKNQDVGFFSVVSRIEGDCTQTFVMSVIKALNTYNQKYSYLPNRIFIYRGGVSDGELGYIRDIELSQLNQAIGKRYNDFELPKMVYLVVSKKINTRFWQRNGNDIRNPEPGTIVDKTITLEERYEFFLVSQKGGQGTISPTNYNILYDTSGLDPLKIQLWTYIQCHLYYNWYGTTRIPAVLQYANKLGFLVSNYMHREPNDVLCHKLFFL